MQLTSAVRGIYLQPSNGAFTPGFVEMRHKYETPGTANLLLNVTVRLPRHAATRAFFFEIFFFRRKC